MAGKQTDPAGAEVPAPSAGHLPGHRTPAYFPVCETGRHKERSFKANPTKTPLIAIPPRLQAPPPAMGKENKPWNAGSTLGPLGKVSALQEGAWTAGWELPRGHRGAQSLREVGGSEPKLPDSAGRRAAVRSRRNIRQSCPLRFPSEKCFSEEGDALETREPP